MELSLYNVNTPPQLGQFRKKNVFLKELNMLSVCRKAS